MARQALPRKSGASERGAPGDEANEGMESGRLNRKSASIHVAAFNGRGHAVKGLIHKAGSREVPNSHQAPVRQFSHFRDVLS
jgi:hypothetical protein